MCIYYLSFGQIKKSIPVSKDGIGKARTVKYNGLATKVTL